MRNVVVRDEPARVPVAPVTAAAEPASSSRAAPAKGARRGRPSRLDAFVGELGTVPDRVIAEKAGVGVPAVAQYRLRRRIPAFSAAVSEKPSEARPLPVPAARTRVAAEPRASKLDALRHLLGALPDGQVADMAGVAHRTVLNYRNKHSIPAYRGHRERARAASAVREAAAPSAEVEHERQPTSAVAARVEAAAVPSENAVPGVVAPVTPSRAETLIAEQVKGRRFNVPPASGTLSGFRVVVTSAERNARFIVVGEDMLDAVVRATRALARRSDGPWTLVQVRLLSEALADGPEIVAPPAAGPKSRTERPPAVSRAAARAAAPRRGTYRSPGEESFELLSKLAEEGASPSERERVLAEFADARGSTSDALRAAARRYATKAGLAYPLMRAPATHDRKGEREALRQKRTAWTEERLRVGAEALDRGATWAEVAKLFGLTTGEGAYQWWSRHAP